MKTSKIPSVKEQDPKKQIKTMGKKLPSRQREVIKLLQKNENIITDNKKKVFVTCGNDARKIPPHTFYNLLNKGLVHHQTEWPFNYVLTVTGERIKV